MKRIFYVICFLFSFNIAYAQAVELITVKTFAKENPTTTFRCRVPAKYDKSSAIKYRLLIYFGGRNTTGENEVKSKPWGTWCDRNGVFLIVPSCKNDNYWEPQKWSGKALLEAIERLKKKYPNICDEQTVFLRLFGRGAMFKSVSGMDSREVARVCFARMRCIP